VKFPKTAAALLLIPLLSGCSVNTPYIKLENRVIIQAVGVDYEKSEDKGVFTVSMQYSTSEKPDATGGGSIKIITGKGRNILEAVSKARESDGQYIFFMQNQILLLGEEVIKNGFAADIVHEYLEYCDRLPDAIVAGCYGKAEDLIEASTDDKNPSRNKFREVMEHSEESGVHPNEEIYENMASSMSRNGAVYIPMLKVEKSEGGDGGNSNEGEKSEPKKGSEGGDSESGGSSGGGGSGSESKKDKKKLVPFGGALVINGKFTAYIDEEASAGLTILLNRAQNSHITFSVEDEDYTIELYHIKTRIKPVWDGKTLSFAVRISAEADRAYNRILFNKLDRLEIYKKAAEEAVLSKVIKAADQSAVKYGGDVLKLEEIVRHYNNRCWYKVEDKWTETLKNAKFTFYVNIDTK